MIDHKKTKALVLALFISLVVNFFLIGNMAARLGDSAVSEVMQRDQQLRQSLSKEDEQVLSETVSEYQKKVRQMQVKLTAVREKVRAIVRAQSYDAEAFEKAFTVAKETEKAALHLMREAREAAMKRMSAEGREIIVKITRLGFTPRDPRADCLVR